MIVAKEITTNHPILRRGSTGEDVKYLQNILNSVDGIYLNIDGVFGPQTEAAVQKFQKAYGLMVDGIVGEKTWEALESHLKDNAPVRLCGQIYRFNEKAPGEPRTSLDDEVRIRTEQFEIEFLIGTSERVNQELDAIRFPNDSFYGCVYGKELPQQGIEGRVFSVDRIEKTHIPQVDSAN